MKLINIEESEVKNQTDAIKWHLKNHGTITSLQAIQLYGATRLSDIIHRLRKQGYDNIITKDVVVTNRFGGKVIIGKYHYTYPISTISTVIRDNWPKNS
jgi:hypothetical protein